VVLEDRDDDGRMDRGTVFLDSLVLPRAVKVLERGVLVAAPPHLWLARDTDGDLRADTREVVRDDYGNPRGNPEHNANGLLWGLDNWIHNSNYEGELRLDDGGFTHRETPGQGQWGVSTDEFGRLFRNSNEDPLRVELVPSHYYARNPDLARSRGSYERVTQNGPVWPVHPTPGVNRGYRERTLRPDSTLAHFTAAAAPTAYTGDRLPAELRNDVFVAEPAGNLVRRFQVEAEADGTLSAENAYEQAEFLASTDERFRPVNVYSAPDGTLYVVDMYRGIIQHRRYITDYLEQQIRARELEQPIGHGRIYRIVREGTRRGPRPALSGASAEQLVGHLDHPNGWWRQTAQRLLVERGDTSVAPRLRRLARRARDERVRLHALWTLDGLDAADVATVESALADRSPHVRAAALRVAEGYLPRPAHPLREAVIARLTDPAPQVRWQLAATLGELPERERLDALTRMLTLHGDDPIAVDAAISGLAGQEMAALEPLLAGAAGSDAVSMLAAAVARRGHAAEVERLLGWVSEEDRPRAQRLALLRGLNQLLPSRGRDADASFPLPGYPRGLLAAAASPDTAVRAAAAHLADRAEWPGKPKAGASEVRRLTPEEEERFAAGARLYQAACAGCHQASGMGITGVAKRLAGSPWVTGDPRSLIRIVLHGKEGEMLMPPVGGSMSDPEVAAVLTYIRRSWGNTASAVAPAEVEEVRGYTAKRERPWTEEELRGAR
jgi:mono/diheme cytochrome c family protein